MNPRNPIILCVDDEPANRKLLENILVANGYEVISAANGKDALLKIKTREIDLVLLDVMMPELNGFEVCREIKESKEFMNIPVIMITALSEKGDRIKGIEAGAEEFLTKPFDRTEVLARIKMLLKVKELKAALAQSEKHYRRIFETSKDGLLILDKPEGNIIDINQAIVDLLGYPREDFLGKKVMDFGILKDAAGFEKVYTQLNNTGFVQYGDVSIETNKGTYVNAEVYFTDESKEIQCNVRDITERKILDQELQEKNAELNAANKELEAFSYSVSHDLRAPLRAIDGFSRKVLAGYGEKLDDEGRRQLQVVRDNAQRMGELIDNLLAFSRMGRREIVLQPLDMHAMVKGVADELLAAEPLRSIEFAISPLPSALGDAAMLRQVWVNLLSNAVKFTRRRAVAHIEVGSGTEGGELLFWVKDDGAGFDMQYADKLFGVFQRLHRQEEFEGTGVGLAIAQRVLLRHHGRIWGEGKPDAGATIWFALPLLDNSLLGGQTL